MTSSLKNPNTAGTAVVATIGCRMNQAESAGLANLLESRGYEIVCEDFEGKVDVCLINTCTVTAKADSDCRNKIRKILRRYPGAFVAVLGCYAQIKPDVVASIKGVDLVLGNADKEAVIDLIADTKRPEPLVVREPIKRQPFEISSTKQTGFKTRANLKIQDGCDFMCSYCIIPFARGRVRSRMWDNLLCEARGLVESGFKEIVLTGINLGTYEYDGKRLIDVVRALCGIDGLARLRLSSVEMTTIDDEFFDLMADPGCALVPYLHMPLQSGSDKILGLMKRKYNLAEFADFANRAVARVPDLCFGSDIMVGFPGETDEDFKGCAEFIKLLPAAYFHVFSYSVRPGTAAQKMPGHVDEPVKKKRSAVLRKIAEDKKRAFAARFVGRKMPVLFETFSDDGVCSGLTENYIRADVAGADGSIVNSIREVSVDSVDGDVLKGHLV